jgi:hypothetical protein
MRSLDLAFQSVGVAGFNLNTALRSHLVERSQATERGEAA